MDFQYTEEQESFRQMTRDFCETHVRPAIETMEKTDEFPHEVIRKCAAQGFLGILIPEAYGGIGLDSITYCLILEEFSRVSASVSMTVNLHSSLVSTPLLMYGTEKQKQRFLPPLAQGKQFGAYAFTEAGAGSDARSQQTTALLQGNHYILNGVKTFATNGSLADWVILMARTDKAAGTGEIISPGGIIPPSRAIPQGGLRPHSDLRPQGFTLFVVDKKESPFQVGKIENKMGIKGSPTAELIFENCRVPKENTIGPPGEGFKIAMHTLSSSRIGLGAQALGIGQAGYEEALKYAKERVQFGKSLAEFQGIQWMLADMAVRLQAARLLVHQAAWLKNTDQPYIKEGSMAKLFATEAASWVCNKALQIHGGYGYCKDYPIERIYRDVRVFEIVEGTSEVQRMIIAKEILKG